VVLPRKGTPRGAMTFKEPNHLKQVDNHEATGNRLKSQHKSYCQSCEVTLSLPTELWWGIAGRARGGCRSWAARWCLGPGAGAGRWLSAVRARRSLLQVALLVNDELQASPNV
jgi:hypothetical protein